MEPFHCSVSKERKSVGCSPLGVDCCPSLTLQHPSDLTDLSLSPNGFRIEHPLWRSLKLQRSKVPRYLRNEVSHGGAGARGDLTGMDPFTDSSFTTSPFATSITEPIANILPPHIICQNRVHFFL